MRATRLSEERERVRARRVRSEVGREVLLAVIRLMRLTRMRVRVRVRAGMIWRK